MLMFIKVLNYVLSAVWLALTIGLIFGVYIPTDVLVGGSFLTVSALYFGIAYEYDKQ